LLHFLEISGFFFKIIPILIGGNEQRRTNANTAYRNPIEHVLCWQPALVSYWRKILRRTCEAMSESQTVKPGEGYSDRFHTGMLRPRSGHLTLSQTKFWEIGTLSNTKFWKWAPLSYTFPWKGTPFTHHSLEIDPFPSAWKKTPSLVRKFERKRKIWRNLEQVIMNKKTQTKLARLILYCFTFNSSKLIN